MALIDGWLKRLKKSTYDYERISTFDASLLFWHTFYALLFNLYNTMCILSTCWGYVSYISYMWHAINFFRKTDILKQGSIKALDEKYGHGFLASPKINFILFFVKSSNQNFILSYFFPYFKNCTITFFKCRKRGPKTAIISFILLVLAHRAMALA